MRGTSGRKGGSLHQELLDLRGGRAVLKESLRHVVLEQPQDLPLALGLHSLGDGPQVRI